MNQSLVSRVNVVTWRLPENNEIMRDLYKTAWLLAPIEAKVKFT